MQKVFAQRKIFRLKIFIVDFWLLMTSGSHWENRWLSLALNRFGIRLLMVSVIMTQVSIATLVYVLAGTLCTRGEDGLKIYVSVMKLWMNSFVILYSIFRIYRLAWLRNLSKLKAINQQMIIGGICLRM
ncbi:hypothetical protein NS29R_02455 [Enterobacter hormaechei subsp. xiangfangensis]|nr:hypothetical protein BFV66_02760 [Enterobacter hormaechei subsp. oharae]KTQ57266.1 hypothetical protein NS23R_10455 [Enterobacter hormaechei]KTQ61423.1 hypothetical protein NS28R_09045 [Enterobacter hormaechei subsp. xiangfangensis]KTQ65206.1 hypothetical protein NS34R_08800 [Enterobacter hormaechei]KTQ70047.1 hypothetical protein NS19R_10770 [Enterobacter hormaechei subsp. xiangfangensis]